MPAASAEAWRMPRSPTWWRCRRKPYWGGSRLCNFWGSSPGPASDDGGPLWELPFPEAVHQNRWPPKASSGERSVLLIGLFFVRVFLIGLFFICIFLIGPYLRYLFLGLHTLGETFCLPRLNSWWPFVTLRYDLVICSVVRHFRLLTLIWYIYPLMVLLGVTMGIQFRPFRDETKRCGSNVSHLITLHVLSLIRTPTVT